MCSVGRPRRRMQPPLRLARPPSARRRTLRAGCRRLGHRFATDSLEAARPARLGVAVVSRAGGAQRNRRTLWRGLGDDGRERLPRARLDQVLDQRLDLSRIPGRCDSRELSHLRLIIPSQPSLCDRRASRTDPVKDADRVEVRQQVPVAQQRRELLGGVRVDRGLCARRGKLSDDGREQPDDVFEALVLQARSVRRRKGHGGAEEG